MLVRFTARAQSPLKIHVYNCFLTFLTRYRELEDSLGVLNETPLQLGITFDSSSGSWKRAGDGQEVELDEVLEIYDTPSARPYVYWIYDPAGIGTYVTDGHNKLVNNLGYSFQFICEREVWKLLGWSFPAQTFKVARAKFSCAFLRRLTTCFNQIYSFEFTLLTA